MKLHFKKYGNGQPLLILHGLFGCSDNWKTLGKKFSEEFQVYLIDLRNHGHSKHSDYMSYDLMADDISELILKEKLEKIILLGHSLGGKTAMRCAQKYPFYVDKLIVADIGVKKYPMHHENIIKGLKAINLDEISSRKEAQIILSKDINDIGTQQLLLKSLYWIKKGKLAWRMNISVLTNKMDNILDEIPKEIVLTPTLFIKGERSNYILESDFEDINYYFPNSDIETIYNAGHWLHAENPLDFYSLVIEFLKN